MRSDDDLETSCRNSGYIVNVERRRGEEEIMDIKCHSSRSMILAVRLFVWLGVDR
jgi:hypothetical protein